jgi:tetratricopeptide (TPR) repeat protein
MITLDLSNSLSSAWQRICVLLGALIAVGCSTSGTTAPGQVELRSTGGFTISERVRAGGSARNDFDDAMRLLEQEEYESAIALLHAVTEAAPEVVAPHIDLGIAYGRVSDLEQAEASIERALELNPRHPVANNELGIVLRRMGRFDEARARYEKALADYPGFHFARRNLAILCDVYLGDLSCAVENYELYTQAVPDDESAAMWIADLRNRLGR